MFRRLYVALLLLVLAALFFEGMVVSLGGDSEAEPMQWLMGILSGLCLVGALAAFAWHRRRS